MALSIADFVIGRRYRLHHSRKGKATVKVTGVVVGDDGDDTWVDVIVVDGALQGIGVGSWRGPGDTLRVRMCLCTFTEED